MALPMSEMMSSTEKKRAVSIGLSETVLEIGRKARRRLEEEKGKRKEKDIICLDESLADSKVSVPRNNPYSEGKRPTDAKALNAERLSDTFGGYSSKESRKRGPTQNDERSDIVRIHGLPRGCQLHHIQKFFSGLAPEKVFILPPLYNTIKVLDLSNSTTETAKGKKGGVPSTDSLYSPYVRICVKFTSVLVADLALQRSGESMDFLLPSFSGPAEISINIHVTPIPKVVATFLDRFMVIDVNKDPLENLVQSIESENTTTNLVYKILWLAMQQQTGVDVHIKTLEMENSTPVETKLINNLHPPQSRDEYFILSSLHNKFWDMHSQIELSQRPFIFKGGYNRRMSLDAAIWLSEQMKIIQGYIYHSLRENIINP